MTEHKHSPLPWVFKDRRTEGKRVQVSTAYNHVGAPPQVCAMWNSRMAAENAAFIVRACNSHYELIEALEHLVGLEVWNADAIILRPAKAAIAKAKGEENDRA